MISLQDGIKYIAIAAIIYFLIKAFANDKLNDSYIVLLVLIIMAIIIFIMSQKGCKIKRGKKGQVEGYQVTDPPVVASIYAGPKQNITWGDSNSESSKINDKPLPYGSMPSWKNTVYQNADIVDFESVAKINKKILHDLIKNEQKAGDKIRSGYEDEMVYTSTHPFNTVPLGTQLYGYTYLPPENWFRAYERPPVCIPDKKCPVCPIADSKTSDLLHFDTFNNNRGPEGINLRYVKKVLNQNKGFY